MHQPSTILDHPLVSSRYFFPRYEALPQPYWVDAADGSRLACSYHVVNPAAKTVIYFHGNGEVVADYLPSFPDWLGQVGYNVFLAEYRGYGMSTGQPALAGMLDDVSAIIYHAAAIHYTRSSPGVQPLFFPTVRGIPAALLGGCG